MEIEAEKEPGSKPLVDLAYFHRIGSLVKVLLKMARPPQLLVIILVYILGSLVARLGSQTGLASGTVQPTHSDHPLH